MDRSRFLPVSKADMAARGIEQLDFVYVSGDAYVDHPSFGTAIISRVLEANGFTVGIIAQPDWRDPASITALGEPKLGFLVSAGNMDSMVNIYTVGRRLRKDDCFSENGEIGKRPPHALTVYAQLVRQAFPGINVQLGGLEAIQKINEEKAAILYDFLDESRLFKGTVRRQDRSLMNVPFVTGSDELDAKFVKEAKEHGLENLKGHRSVGGMRASIYNAMPIEGVKALVDFMKQYEAEVAHHV